MQTTEARSTAGQRAHLRAAEQAIVDLAHAGAASVTFVRAPTPAAGDSFVAEHLKRASKRGFVTAEVSLFSDRAFDSLHALVRSLARALAAPGAGPEERGLVTLLDRFLEAKGDRAPVAFERAAASMGAVGDLALLVRGYLDAAGHARREARRIDAWLAGTETSRAEERALSLSALSPRNAKSALADLTRVVRALGRPGLVVAFTGADVVPRLPDARRRDAYTVLRELVDNADGGHGMTSAQVLVVGGAALYDGPRSLASLPPLAMRILPYGEPAPPTPHRPLVDLGTRVEGAPGEVRATDAPPVELRAIIRASHGLPPIDAVATTTVGYEEIDRAIDGLFEHSAMEGSVFGLLTGRYGTGKTHLLLHLVERALADRRPVLRLSLERLDADLGSPQRHYRRLLENAVLPAPARPSLLDALAAATRDQRTLERLLGAIADVANEGGDASLAARRALAMVQGAKSRGAALEAFLGGAELVDRPSQPTYRQAAYARLLLWLALLDRVEGWRGPVVLIDEAENLYTGGLSRAERRTALRSLAFYCGGVLPRACVVLAITPDALGELKREAQDLLGEVADQATVLDWEDASMLARRLKHARPMEVPALGPAELVELAGRVRKIHTNVRGPLDDRKFRAFADALATSRSGPREVVRRTVERLESAWWTGEAARRP